MSDDKIIEAGRKEGTIFVSAGLNWIVTRQYTKKLVPHEHLCRLPVEQIQTESSIIDVGKCFDCGESIGHGNTFGIQIKGQPAYIQCPSCGAINNYSKRVVA